MVHFVLLKNPKPPIRQDNSTFVFFKPFSPSRQIFKADFFYPFFGPESIYQHHTWYILRFRTFQVVPLFISRTAPNFRVRKVQAISILPLFVVIHPVIVHMMHFVLLQNPKLPNRCLMSVFWPGTSPHHPNFSAGPNRTFEFGTARHLLIFLFAPSGQSSPYDGMDRPKIKS